MDHVMQFLSVCYGNFISEPNLMSYNRPLTSVQPVRAILLSLAMAFTETVIENYIGKTQGNHPVAQSSVKSAWFKSDLEVY